MMTTKKSKDAQLFAARLQALQEAGYVVTRIVGDAIEVRKESRDTAQQYLTVKEALAYAGVGKTRFFELMNSGEIPARSMGGRTLVSRKSLDRYRALASKPRKKK